MSLDTWDVYGTYASGAQSDPKGATLGTSRVARGGGWFNDAYYCRAAVRSASNPASGLGFRVLRSSAP